MAGASRNLLRSLNNPSRLGNVLGWVDLSVSEPFRERGLFIKDWDAEILGLAFRVRFQRKSCSRDRPGSLTQEASWKVNSAGASKDRDGWVATLWVPVVPFPWYTPLGADILVPAIRHVLPGRTLRPRTLFWTFLYPRSSLDSAYHNVNKTEHTLKKTLAAFPHSVFKNDMFEAPSRNHAQLQAVEIKILSDSRF